MAKKTSNGLKIKAIIIIVLAVVIGLTYFARVKIESLINGEALAEGKVEEANSAEFAVHYIDVGQGDAIYIALPDGKNMLIDAGPGKSEDKLLKYLKKLNIDSIEYLVLTHSDEDHSGGIDVVLNNFYIKNVYRPCQVALGSKNYSVEDPLADYFENKSYSFNTVETTCYATFVKLAYSEKDKDGNSAQVCVFYDGLTIDGEAYKFEFFAPQRIPDAPAIGTVAGSPNANIDQGSGFPTKFYGAKEFNSYSPCIVLSHNSKTFMFTGDMENEAEDDLISSLTVEEKDRLKCIDVFKCGHHGSRTSSKAELLEIIKPSYYIISCGKDNSYKHPHAELMTRVNNDLTTRFGGSEGRIYRTDENGDLVFYAKEDNLSICAYNFTSTHYFTWFEVAGGAFVTLSIVVLCFGSPSSYKKIKRYTKNKK